MSPEQTFDAGIKLGKDEDFFTMIDDAIIPVKAPKPKDPNQAKPSGS
jgi:hypothetical protein